MRNGALKKDLDFETEPPSVETFAPLSSRRGVTALADESSAHGLELTGSWARVGRRRYSTPVALLVSVTTVVHYLWLITRSPEVMFCFVPDDAFYELQIARHFLATGRWSFDRGFTTTTGFHLLNVYLMSLFPQILNHPMWAVRFWMAVGVILSIASAFVICRFAERTFGPFALLPAFLILTARYIVLGNASLLEFPFVVLTAALYVSVLLRDLHPASRRTLVELLLLGLIGSLARSDFGGLPLALAGACAIRWLWTRNRDYFPQSIWGLAGSTAGLLVVCTHNFLLSGHIVSGSALMKAFWGQRYGYSVGPALSMLNSAIVSYPWELRAIAFIIGAGVVCCAAWDILRARREAVVGERSSHAGEADDHALLVLSGVAAVVLYLLVYGFDPVALQPWYLANFVVPMVLIFGWASRWIESKPLMQASAAIALAFVIVPQLNGPYAAPWYWQKGMYKMGEYLEQHPVKARIAGWNVGIVGYLTDGRVTNLDGLMNDQIFPYVRDGLVEDYISQMHIDYLVDYPVQMRYSMLKVYGYNGVRLSERLTAIHSETGVDDPGAGLDDTLYRVNK